MELTKEHFEQIIEGLPTKADLAQFATVAEMDAGFTAMRSELADKKDIDRVLTAVDAIAKQMNHYNQELPAIKHQLQTINDWIKEAAQKIGIEYKA